MNSPEFKAACRTLIEEAAKQPIGERETRWQANPPALGIVVLVIQAGTDERALAMSERAQAALAEIY